MHKKLKIVGGSLLAVWVALNPAHALGEEKNDELVSIPQGSVKRPMTAVEKSDEVRRFSINNPDGIGVFINFANPPEMPPERLVAMLNGAFGQKGIKADFQFNQSERGDITTITFFREGAPFTYSLGKSPTGLQHATQGMGKKAEELHSSPLEQGR